jgi:ribose transport system ATP-binding protein
VSHSANISSSLLTIKGLNKSFAAPVLRDFEFALQAGEVHALVGGNGAGKSTFANILAGLLSADSGSITLHGQPYAPRSRREAAKNGVILMLQELHLIPTLSIAENLFLDRLPSKLGWVSKKTLRAQAAEALSKVGLDALDPFTPAGQLGIGQQQLVVLAGALMQDCRIIILDEPTAALTAKETGTLFAHLHRLRREGKGIIYISHRMEELREIADNVSVLRDGQRIASLPMAQANIPQLIRLMAGRELSVATSAQKAAPDASRRVALRVNGLNAGPQVQDIHLEVHAGEIFGIYGLVGAGRTETLRAIFGADPHQSGTIEVGQPLQPVIIRHPSDAVRCGIGLVPEDRKQEGLLLPEGLRINSTLANLKGLLLSSSKETAQAQSLREQLEVKCHDLDQPAQTLSGGNQQKIVLARWLHRDVEVLLLDEPTRGVDAAAKATIYQQLREFAARGKALLVVSSEAPELLALCDRIAVMSSGRLVETRDTAAWNLEDLTHAAFSGHLDSIKTEPKTNPATSPV